MYLFLLRIFYKFGLKYMLIYFNKVPSCVFKNNTPIRPGAEQSMK